MFLNSLAGKQKHVNVIQHLVSHSLKSDAKGSFVSSHLESSGSASQVGLQVSNYFNALVRFIVKCLSHARKVSQIVKGWSYVSNKVVEMILKGVSLLLGLLQNMVLNSTWNTKWKDGGQSSSCVSEASIVIVYCSLSLINSVLQYLSGCFVLGVSSHDHVLNWNLCAQEVFLNSFEIISDSFSIIRCLVKYPDQLSECIFPEFHLLFAQLVWTSIGNDLVLFLNQVLCVDATNTNLISKIDNIIESADNMFGRSQQSIHVAVKSISCIMDELRFLISNECKDLVHTFSVSKFFSKFICPFQCSFHRTKGFKNNLNSLGIHLILIH